MIQETSTSRVPERCERPPQAEAPRGEERLILWNVSWGTYEHLLADHEDRSAPRFAFDQGTLEIMSPLEEHEEANRAFHSLVETLAVEWEREFRNLGSTTFKRADEKRGFEPDSCFYIQSAQRIEGKTRLDLTVDPAPDLVIEVDITHSSLNKLPIYAAFGVPEVWRYRSERVEILVLEGAEYRESDRSQALPELSTLILNQFMGDLKTTRRTAWIRCLQEWARSQRRMNGER
jgi:Uma2 family endonuclease